MARLRYNNALGTLGASLAASSSAAVGFDASSPPAPSGSGGTFTTAAFSPPAGTLLLVMAAGYGGLGSTGISVTDNKGTLTWTKNVDTGAANSQEIQIHTSVVPSGGLSGLTISVVLGPIKQAVWVFALSGAGGVGATAQGGGSTVSLTPTHDQSLVFAMSTNGSGSTATPTGYGAGQTNVINGITAVTSAATYGGAWAWMTSSPQPVGTPVNMSFTGGNASGPAVAFEIFPAATPAPVAITFAAAPPFATLAGGDYIPLVLDPPSAGPNAAFEIVYLTAYTAGGTTGTVARAQEGTAAANHANGAAWVCAPTVQDVNITIPTSPSSSYAPQNGAVNSGDAALSSLSINTSTGALSFSSAAANPIWVKSAAGILVPVALAAGASTLTPGTLPTTGNSRVMGIEVDTNGVVSVVPGASVSGQLTTAAAIETNTPAVTSGKLRIADIGVYNNAGAYNFSNASTTATQGTNWVDRRPWARGAYNKIARNQNAAGGNNFTYPGSSVPIDATNLATRLECSGVPVRLRFVAVANVSNAKTLQLHFRMDGVQFEDNSALVGSGSNVSGNYFAVDHVWDYTPSAGSHLFTPYWDAGNTTSGSVIFCEATLGVQFTVDEIVKQNASNGAV